MIYGDSGTGKDIVAREADIQIQSVIYSNKCSFNGTRKY